VRAVVQRVRRAEVVVEGRSVGTVDRGLLVYIGVEQGDTESDRMYVASKVAGMRIFPDEEGRMNRSLDQLVATAAEKIGILAVSQFTLHGDMRKGRRPSYNASAPPDQARGDYEALVEQWRDAGILVDSRKLF
jgi:D-tyrosyl-tRNA(Tyr) deacylase